MKTHSETESALSTSQEMGATINARMGLNTWAAFYGGDTEAVVAEDVAKLESEVTPVLKALRANGIDVVNVDRIKRRRIRVSMTLL